MDPTQWDVPFPVMVAMMFVIVFFRAGATYLLGRAAAAGAERTRIARMMDAPGYRRATRLIGEYGSPLVAVSFLTVGFQTLANLAAGATRMPLPRYLPALLVGGVMWALLYSAVGLVGVDLFGRLFDYSPVLAIGSLTALIGGYAGFVVWKTRRHLSS